MNRPRVAVVGGGVFGATAAVHLARSGCRVELYERCSDLLMGASGSNQNRLHVGYHYPRSIETALSSREAERDFRAEFGASVVDSDERYYGVAREGSKVSGDQYLRFLDYLSLEYRRERPAFVNHNALDVCVRVREGSFDPRVLRELAKRKLREAGVRVHLRAQADYETVRRFNQVVLAAYARQNHFLRDAQLPIRMYQFEVCEKLLLEPPPDLMRKSLVVLDGDFMCIDPLGTSQFALAGHVVHAIHAAAVGASPVAPTRIHGYLDRGVIKKPIGTRYPLFVETAAKFMPSIVGARHPGSLFTVRAVLPGLETTDARPTLVERLSEKVVTIFSGKIGTCVQAARQTVALVKGAPTRRSLPQLRDAPRQYPLELGEHVLAPLDRAGLNTNARAPRVGAPRVGSP